jgi:HPt (histidine-containing phosphotransfer) domain-containing protein
MSESRKSDKAKQPDGEPADELPATDATALDRLKRFGGGKLLDEMIALYLAAAPERMAAARAGLDAKDVAATELALHSLKSSSAQLGAMRMQRLSEKGEHLTRTGSLDDVVPLVDDLYEEFPRVQTWLERARHTEHT